MKAVVFDLDGTLVDSAPDLHAAAVKMMAALNLPAPSLDAVTSFIGNGVPTLVGRCLASADVAIDPATRELALARFLEFYAAAPAVRTRPFTGVEAMLTALRAAGLRLGVCTNKEHGLAQRVLGELGLASYFEQVVGGDTLAVRKPDPAPLHLALERLGCPAADALYVGDGEVDAETAAAAGVGFALFSRGYRLSPVELLPADFVFDRFPDLAGFVLARECAA